MNDMKDDIRSIYTTVKVINSSIMGMRANAPPGDIAAEIQKIGSNVTNLNRSMDTIMKIVQDEIAREEQSHSTPPPSGSNKEPDRNSEPGPTNQPLYRDVVTTIEKGPSYLGVVPPGNSPATPKDRREIDKSNVRPAVSTVNATLEPKSADLNKDKNMNESPTAGTSKDTTLKLNGPKSKILAGTKTTSSGISYKSNTIDLTKSQDSSLPVTNISPDTVDRQNDGNRIVNGSGSNEMVDRDVFVGVSRRKKIATYYIGNIDKKSTYGGFVKFLESKGIKATQIRMFYRPNSISARINIPSVFSDKVEEASFWPDEMTCRKWVAKTEWEKEQASRREEYENKRRSRYYDGDNNRYDRSDTYRSDRTDTRARQHGYTHNDSYYDKDYSSRYYDKLSYSDKQGSSYNSKDFNSNWDDSQDRYRGERDDWWDPS